MMTRTKYSLICKTMLFCTALFALVLQCGMGAFTAEPLQRFSMLYALLAAFYYFFALIAHSKTWLAVWFPSLKLSITISGLLVCAVVSLLLPDVYQGCNAPERLSLQLAHYVLPVGMLLDWLLFDPRGVLRMSDPFLTLLPAGLYTILAWYGDALGCPLNISYWFLDRTELGDAEAWSVVLGLAGGMLIAAYILYLLDFLLDSDKKKTKKRK
jgi:hypothetical protein